MLEAHIPIVNYDFKLKFRKSGLFNYLWEHKFNSQMFSLGVMIF